MKNKRLEYFDLGRFIAICGVILVHTSQYSESSYILSKTTAGLGRFGIQLFFVISGATIFMSYTNNPSVNKFYIKRFFRIVPLFISMGLVYSFLKDVSFWETINPINVFNPSNLNIIEGGWSIWNEIYFYILAPFYLKIRKNNYNILIFSLITFALSVIFNFRLIGLPGNFNQLSDFDYLNIFTQLSCFVLGIEFISNNFKRAACYLFPQLIFGFLLKLWCFPEFIFSADFGANHWVVIIALISTLILKALHYGYVFMNFSRFHLIRLMQRLGQLTYTSYMIHFLIIRLFNKLHYIDFGIEINFILIATTTFITSYYLQPFTETLPNSLGKRILNLKKT